MTQHIIIICIITILLWYYYTKSKDNDDKYIPVMIRQSELLHENTRLKQDNKKLKIRVKYLENYKSDVSKTFKILDSELGLINDHIKNKQPPTRRDQEEPRVELETQPEPRFRTSITPTVLNSLLRTSQEPTQSDNMLDSIFNRFLTGDMHFINQQRQSPAPTSTSPTPSVILQHQQRQRQQRPPPPPPPQREEELNNVDDNVDNTGDILNEKDFNQEQMESDLYDEEQAEPLRAPLSFSVNYLPLSSTYRQYLIRNDIPNTSNAPNAPNAPNTSNAPHS